MTASSPMPRRVRWPARWARWGVVCAVAVVASGAAGWGALRSAPGQRWLAARLVDALQGAAGDRASVQLSALATNGWDRWELRDLRVVDPAGRTLLRVERIGLHWTPTRLLRGEGHARSLAIEGLVVDAAVQPDGRLDLVAVFAPNPAPAGPAPRLPLPIDIDALTVAGAEGAIRAAGDDAPRWQWASAAATARVSGVDSQWTLSELVASGALGGPASLPVALAVQRVTIGDGAAHWQDANLAVATGAVTSAGAIDGTGMSAWVALDRVDLALVDPWLGAPGVAGRVGGQGSVLGSWSDLRVVVGLSDPAGDAGGVALTARVRQGEGPPRWQLAADLDGVEVGAWFPAAGAIRLDGALGISGEGASWPDGLTADATFVGAEQWVRGVPFRGVALGARLADGALTLEHGHFTGLTGAWSVTGPLDLAQGPVALQVDATVEPASLAEWGLTGLDTAGSVHGTVVGDLRAGDGTWRFDGAAHWAPLRFGPAVAFDRVDVDLHASVAGGAVTVDGRARTGAGVVSGVGIAASDTPQWRVRRAADGALSAAGTSRLSSVTLGAADVEEVSAQWRWTQPPVGDAAYGATLAARRVGVAGFTATTADVVVAGGRGRTELTATAWDGTREAAHLAAALTGGGTQIDVSALRVAPTPRASWAAAPGARARRVPGGVADASLAVTGNLGAFALAGDFATTGAVDGSLVVTDLQLDTFAEWFPDTWSGLSGVVTGRVALVGPADDVQVRGSGRVDDLWWEGRARALDLTATWGRQGDQLAVTAGLAGPAGPLADLRAAIPVRWQLASPGVDPDGPTTATLALRPAELVRWADVLPALGPVPPGRVSGALTASGTPRDPALQLSGVWEGAVAGWTDPARVEWDARRDGTAVAGQVALLRGVERVASVGGTAQSAVGAWIADAWSGGPAPDPTVLERWADQLDLAFAVTDADVGLILGAAGWSAPLGGRLVGGGTVRGSARAPVLAGALDWVDGTVGEQAVRSGRVVLAPQPVGYRVTASLDFPDEGALTVSGDVPIAVDLSAPVAEWAQGELDLAVDGRVPLGVLTALHDGIHDPSGSWMVSGSVVGPVWDPSPQLTGSITGGALSVAPLGLAVSDIELAFQSTERRIRLQRFTAHTAPLGRAPALAELGADEGSTVSASGTLQLAAGVPSRLTASVTLADGAWVAATPDAQLRLDGDLEASGPWSEVRWTGDLAVRAGRVALDATSFTDAGPLALDPRIRVARKRARASTAPPDPASWVAGWEAEVGIALQRNLDLDWRLSFVDDFGAFGAAVARMDLAARLGGDLRARWSGGALGLTGELAVLEGSVRMLRSQFALREGTITFAGGDPTAPFVDLSGEMAVTGGSLALGLAGTPAALVPTLTSEAYPDQSTQLAILLTGRAPDELTSSQGSAAAEAVAGVLLNSVLQGVQLGQVGIDPSGMVRVGIPVSQRVYAESMLNPAATVDENRLAVQVEWSALPRLVLDAGLGDVQSWTDVFWEIRF